MSTSSINQVLQNASVDMSGEANHWTTKRRAFFFKPGTYGSAAELNPALATNFINSEIGYYTSVAGLGLTPDQVQINGALHVEPEQICDTPWWCQGPGSLNNFWRSLSNVAIKPIQRPVSQTTTQPGAPVDGDIREGWIEPGRMRWSVSQAAPMRRVHIQGDLTYMGRYGAMASGGFTADSKIDGLVQTGSQQQFYHRDSTIGSYSEPGVWNMVFSGTNGAPADSYPDSQQTPDMDQYGANKHANYGNTPISREAPFLTWNQTDGYGVWVPAARTNASGPSWSGSNPGAGTRISLNDFVVAKPGVSIASLNTAISNGKHILFTPGQYTFDQPLRVNRTGTVVLGLGLATIRPTAGNAAIEVGDVAGVKIAGLMIEAHSVKSEVLVQVGPRHATVSNQSDPTTLSDVFFRIGGAQDGNIDTALEVNSDYALLDNIWSWRADHGNDADVNVGYQWERNPANVGVRVNGDNVTALGLFVEHYQKTQTEWNGNNGRTIFYQSEIPYEPRTQAQHSDRGREGYSSYKVDASVANHELFGAGVYSYYRWVDTVWAENAISVPKKSTVKVDRAVTRWLNGCIPSLSASKGITDCTDGLGGGIRHIVNDQGGPAFSAGNEDNKTKWMRSYNSSTGDVTKPTLNANVSGTTLTASASDNVTAANLIHIDYKIGCSLWQPYTGTVTIPGDAQNVWARAVDRAGNVSNVYHWSRAGVAEDCQPGDTGGGDTGGGDTGGGDTGGGDTGGGDTGGGDTGGGDTGGGDTGGGDTGGGDTGGGDTGSGTTGPQVPMPLVISNKSGKSDAVYIYILGRNTSNQTGWIDASGTFHALSGGTSTPAPVGDISITGPANGQSLTVSSPLLSSGRIYYSYGQKLSFSKVIDGDGITNFAYPSIFNTSDPNRNILHGSAEYSLVRHPDQNTGLWFNSSQVDFVGPPVQVGVEQEGGSTYSIGRLKDNGLQNIITYLQSQPGWGGLVKQNGGQYLRVLSAKDGVIDGALATAPIASYVDQVWNKYRTTDLTLRPRKDDQNFIYTGRVSGDNFVFQPSGSAAGSPAITITKPNPQNVVSCDGSLTGVNIQGEIARTVCAGFNRSNIMSQTSQPAAPATYFTDTAWTNHYVKIVHDQMVSGRAYAFAYDDVSEQESLVATTNPQKAFLQLDPFTGAATPLGNDSGSGGNNGGGDTGGGDTGGGDTGGGDTGGGDTGGTTCIQPWDGNAVYVQGDRVTLATQVYEAQWWTQGETPGTTGEWGVWRVVGVDTGCEPGGNGGTGGGDTGGTGDGYQALTAGTSPIKVAGLNLCVDVPSSNFVNGNKLQAWTCNGTGAQSWTRNANGEIRIGTRCVDVASSGTANGTDVWLYNCNNTGAQKWEYNPSTKTLRNPNSGKCLDIRDGQPTPVSGQKLQIWDCWGDINQRWEF